MVASASIAQNSLFSNASTTDQHDKIATVNYDDDERVTIINKTGEDIYLYEEGYRNGTRINVNSSTKVDCSVNYTYKFDSNASGSGTECYSANSACGSSITIK